MPRRGDPAEPAAFLGRGHHPAAPEAAGLVERGRGADEQQLGVRAPGVEGGEAGPGGQRGSVSAAQAMIQPYPRIVVLHVSVLLAFGLGLGGFASSSWGEWGERLRPVLAALPADWRTPGVAVVVLLVVVKTGVDLVTTRWAVRAR